MTHENEAYIYDLSKNLDWGISIHRCADFAGGVIFMELNYKDQKHVMVLNSEQAEKISFTLHHASLKLREEIGNKD